MRASATSCATAPGGDTYFLSHVRFGSHGVQPSTVRRSRLTSSQSTHSVATHTPHKTAPIHHLLEFDSRAPNNAIGPTVPATAHTT